MAPVRIISVIASACVVVLLSGVASAQTNLAMGKPATASAATYPAHPASTLTDGNAETFSHPNASSGTIGFYYQIDLQSTQELERVVITGRGDGCCPERLSNYKVELRADNNGVPGAVNWSGILRADDSYPASGESDTVIASDGTGTFAGRFIRIVNVANRAYNPQIAEVAAYGIPAPVIRLFAASSGNITATSAPGLPTQTTLAWDVTGATSYSISPVVGTVTGPTGAVVVQPATTTTYTLTATRGSSSSQATVTIGVDLPFTAPVISELVASNDGLIEDEDGEDSDWVEIYNPNLYSLNLKNAHLTDKSNTPTMWTFPDAMVPPGGYLVVFASSKNRAVAGRELHTNFSLGQGGEYLGLRAPGGSTVWSHYSPSFPAQTGAISYGVPATGPAGYLTPVTPGAANPATAKAGFTAVPAFSVSRGLYTATQNITLTCATSGASIRYTTDGSKPTETTGILYAGPITVPATTVVRAVAHVNNYVPSAVVTHTYIFPTSVIANTALMRT